MESRANWPANLAARVCRYDGRALHKRPADVSFSLPVQEGGGERGNINGGIREKTKRGITVIKIKHTQINL